MNYVEYDESNLQSFEITQKAISNGSLIGTCELGTAEIEMINNSNEYSEFKNKWIKSPFGSLYVYNVEPKQEKVSIKMSCYDIKALMDAEYKQSDFEILFPCTIVSWRNAIASSLGLQFNDGNVFPNSNFTLTKHPYIEAGSSCRDVMKIIAQACASWVESDSNDKLYFKWINDNEIVIPDWLELTTEKTSTEPVNMVVLGRGDVEDIEIYPNPKPDNPVEFRIDNNYILDPQDTTTTEDRRKDVIQPIYNQVNGFTYIPFTMRTQSVENTFDVKLGTKVKYIDIWENELTSIVMSRTLKWLGNDINNQNNYELSISAEDIKETSSDYQKARPADKITQLEVSVDKQNELIKINATNIEENKKDLADITVTTKEIKASVESLDKNFQTEITTRKTATGNPTYIEDSGGYALEKDFIYGMSIQETSTASANKLDLTRVKNGWIDITTGAIITNSSYPNACYSDKIYVKSGETFYLLTNGTECRLRVYYADGTYKENSESQITYTASEDVYIRVLWLDTIIGTPMVKINDNSTTQVDFVPNSPSPDYPSEIINNRGIENLCDGINQGYYLNIACTACGKTASDSGLVISTNGATKFTISTKVIQARFRVACSNELPIISASITAYNGINRDGKNQSITIDTTGYSYLIVNATDLPKIQIEKGSIEHPRVPYGSNYLVQKITGSNILDNFAFVKGRLDNGVLGYQANTDSLTPTNDSISFTTNANYRGIVSEYITVNSNQLHILSSKTLMDNYGCQCACYDENKNFISNATIEVGEDRRFITPNNAKYIRLYIFLVSVGTITIENIILSTKVTEYEPYKENPVLFDLQGNELCKIGNIKDEIDLVSGVLTKKIGEVVLDGSEDWRLTESDNTTRRRFDYRHGLSNIDSNFYHRTNTHFINAGYENNANTWGNYYMNKTWLVFNDNDRKMADLETFKTWLKNQYEAGMPVTIQYALAEPQTIQIEPTEIITYEGINNIYTESNVDVEEVDITYLTKSTLNQDFLSKAEFSIKENEINQQVSQKVGENEIVASINTAIKDGQGVLELTGNTVIIDSDNMSVDENGNLICENAVIRGSELILNDDGTHENASIKIKTNKKIIKDIAITSDLNDSYLTQTFGDKFNFAEAASQIIFTTDKNYQVKLLRTTIGSSSHVVGYTHQVVVSNNNDYNEIIYEVFHNQDEGIFTTNIDIQELQLPSEFGLVKTINSSTYLPYIKKLLINAGLTTYSSEGMEADIYSNYKYTRDDYIKVQKYLLGQVTLTTEEILFYDTNGDGKVTLPDMIVIGNNGGQYNVSDSQPGKFILDTTGINENLYVLDKDGNKVVSMGVTGTKVLTLNHPVFPDSHNQIEVGDALTYKKSELESVCGTWDDGKLIYRRVIHVENISATAIPNWSARLDLDIDIDTMVKIEGSYQVTGNAWTPINMPLSSSQAISTHYNVDTKQLHIMSTFDISRGHIILEYTKN